MIFKNLEEHIEHIALVLLVTALSMIAYFLTSPQPPRERTKPAFALGVIVGTCYCYYSDNHIDEKLG